MMTKASTLWLLATACQCNSALASGTASLAAEIAALAELQRDGSLTAAEFSAAKQALIAERGAPPSTPDDTLRRQLQHSTGGAPLPPPSGTCPDVTGVQQALDEATARIAALEVYTDVSAAPRGLIAMWSGALDALPQGWALCDGTSGTPDLRDKFVVAAGSRYGLGSSTEVGENVGASFSWVREHTTRTIVATV
eukprot:COSAG02_NODE_3922_length_6041_cov_11.166274_3_plen_195_part_00